MSDPDNSPGRLSGFSVVSGLTLLSRFTGLGRDILMAALFGTGWVLDAFTVAFRIPGLFRKLFGEGAMTAAFLPQFVDEDRTHGRESASALFSETVRRLTIWLTTIVLIAEAGLTAVYLFGELSERSQLLVELTMITLPYSVLICIAALYCAGLNAVQHFVVPAALQIVLNAVWVAGGLTAVFVFAESPNRARMIAVMTIVGGILQLGIAAWMAARHGIRRSHSPASRELRNQVNRLFRLMVPVLFGLSITQMNAVIDSVLAWWLAQPAEHLPEFVRSLRLPEGTASAIYLGQRLFQFPLGVFGIALGTVLFPRFARHASAGEHRELGRDIIHGLQLVLVVGVPAGVGLWLLSEPITNLLFRHGAFGARDVRLTALMIACYGIGVGIFCGLLIVNRVFYAAGDQTTPVRQGLVCVAVNIILNIVLLPWLKEAALPIAGVLATLVQLGLAMEVLRRRFLSNGYAAFLPVLWRTLLGTLVMTAGCFALVQWIPTGESISVRIPPVVIPVVVGAAIYWLSLQLTGLSLKRLLTEPCGESGRN